MSANKVLVIHEQFMQVEAAVAAFFQMVNTEKYTLLKGVRGCSFEERLTCPQQEKWDRIILIGTYWQKNMKQFYDNANSVVIYSYGDEVEINEDNKCQVEVVQNTPENTISPLDFAINYCKTHDAQSIRMINLIIKTNQELFETINKRSMSLNTMSTQAFFTGFYNYFKTDDCVEHFLKLYANEVDYQSICKYGQAIVDSQILMAAERAKKNSKIITLADGRDAIITEAPELTNLTHDALKEKNRNIGVTICVRMVFSEPNTRLAFSVRTHDGSDARELVKKSGGGGSETAAGCDIPFNLELQLPF
jgi:hypothetical protein